MKKTWCRRARSVGAMFNTLSHVFLWVRDQQEAKDFYVGKLGFEVGSDVTLDEYGGMRWLTVCVPGGVQMVLAPTDGSFVHDPDGPAFLRDMLSRGLGSGGILTVDDCRASYEELRGRGVEFSEEPTEHFYGVDAAFRDPSGNQWRMTQPAA
jgi:catechol 2,3-dioxygenase-like lactoylglutathione lyase family enzyme